MPNLNNILEEKIQENEKVYLEGKEALVKILINANTEYSSLLKDYKNKINSIKNDSLLSSEGKKTQATRIHDDFINRIKAKAFEYNKSLITSTDSTIELINVNKINNYSVLIGSRIPQIIYVNAMLNSIDNLQDAPMLKEVFEYACLEDNFSTEIINLIYMKANSMLNSNDKIARKISGETQSDKETRSLNEQVDVNKIINNSKAKTIIAAIITEINKFKHDYLTDFSGFKNTFENWSKNSKFPNNLYISKDISRDFALEGVLNIRDPWAVQKKNNKIIG